MDAASNSDVRPPPAGEWTPAAHLRLALLRSALALLVRATRALAPLDEVLAAHPAPQAHIDAAAACGLSGLTLEAAVARLDERLGLADGCDLPLQRLREALQLDAAGLDPFLLCALAEEDPGLGGLIDALRGHDGRPTRALLADAEGGAPASLEPLLAAGFLCEQVQGRWRTLAVPAAVRQALQGAAPGHTPSGQLPRRETLILPPALCDATAPGRIRHPPGSLCWVLRGPEGSGRRALAGALARTGGLGLLEPDANEDPVQLAARATLLGAMPLLAFAPAPGEQVALPPLPGLQLPVAVCLPAQGGLTAPGRRLLTLALDLPGPAERALHWRAELGTEAVDPALVAWRLPRGQIHRVAAQCGGDPVAVAAQVEADGRWRLEALAQRVAPLGPQEALALAEPLQLDLELLLARCRHRESLPQRLPAAFGHGGAAGVRALFKGPSGTGKTLAARQLAAALGRPLFRVDLAAIVSKYIGETERNLERVFEAAEALDIVLLLDEGDALMAGRTQVGNANDRYANLETNYLLQRLESYDGILVVTTNAADRIDPAFARRMDATLDFALPDPPTRLRLWHAHLPAGHRLDGPALEELARRCALSGGQIRNAALQATLLALEDGTEPGATEVVQALQREYRRAGQSCPSLALGAGA